MNDNKELKEIIREIKFRTGLTQAQIAEKLGNNSTYLSDVINGRVPFSDIFKTKIYKVFSDYIPNKEIDKKEVNKLLSESIILSKEIVETLIVRLSETLNAQQETINSQQETINTLIGEIKKGGVRQDDNVSCADAG